MSGKISTDQVHSRLMASLNKLQSLRENTSIPQDLLDLWESKFDNWISEFSDVTEEVL